MKIQKAKIILISTTAILFSLFTTAHAANFTVTRADDRNMTCNSNVDCSLREAINAANGASGSNTITFNSVSGVQLAATLPSITTTIIINGGSGVTVSGDAANLTFRAFTVTNTGNLSLDNLTVTNAKEILGGGLLNQNGGAVSMTNCAFTFNRATLTAGGGIFNDGMMTLTNTVVNFNSASSRGDGISNGTNGNLTLMDSTVSFNGEPMQPSGIGGGGIDNAGILTVTRSIIHGNLTNGNGGGIFTLSGTVKMLDSIVSFNSASGGNDGGGIFNGNGGMLIISNSTISDSNTGTEGGGIFNDTSATLTMTNSTVSTNMAITGGGIYNFGTANLRNTIVAGNNANSSPDVFGMFATPAFNLIGKSDGSTGFTNNVNGNIIGTIAMPVDAMLAPLTNNGGTTRTHALMMGSPAANAGSNMLAVDPNSQPLTTDQRGAGFSRIIGGRVDIGSFESAFAPTAASVSIGGRVLTARGRGIFRAQVSMTDSSGTARSVFTNPFGYYHFVNVPAGETYIFTISHKHYVFAPQIVAVTEEIENFNFTAQPLCLLEAGKLF